MTSLRPNLVKRIERLPKPTNVASAMQPLFEAVSNSIHSTQARFGDDVSEKGRVTVTVNTSRNKNEVWATVEDNGNGLNEKNWDAFTTTDTDNKIEIGGKGVGRLMWLDCFESIRVKSTYTNDGSALRRKSFDFVLALDNQIRNLSDEAIGEEVDVGFFVRFTGLRNNAYRDKFPGRDSFIFQHFTSHFLPSFIGGGSESRDYPDAISEIVHRQDDAIDLDTAEYGVLTLTLMECSKVASSDLKGKHFVHFIAHDRTVHSQCIDGKLGLNYFGENSDRVFHAIVTGQFLDSNVNQERTAFTFEDAVIERIINDVCSPEIEVFLEGPISELRGQQREKIEQITATYPSVAFGAMEELQQRVPSGELKEDAIYGHLARERFRRDERQAEKIRHVLTRLKDTSVEVDDFFDAIRDAGSAIEEADQKSPAEYVVRRKVVLDFIEILLEKVRADTKDSSYQREDVLHSFICPIRVETLTEGGSQFSAASSHDLWIVDERLTFAQYFSSDVEFSKISETMDSDERADVLVFDYVHGLRQTEEPSKVLLVEFKRPGRTSYNADENPQFQIERYVKQLQSGNLTDIKGRPIKLDGNTIFYCFIVADIVGKMDDWSYSWQRTANGRGRVYRPDSGFRGSIELISWDDLITDARNRNQAFFDKAGISGQSFFSSE